MYPTVAMAISAPKMVAITPITVAKTKYLGTVKGKSRETVTFEHHGITVHSI